MSEDRNVTPSGVAPLNLSPSQSMPIGSKSSSVEHEGFYLRTGKRLFDIVLSFFGLIFLTPMLVVISLLVKFSSPGPVFFRQCRVGKGGKTFRILKFRSMVDGAERIRAAITPCNDRRVTSIGAFLREWKLDELPQLWNVLIGEMSIVGPRPELPSYVAEYTREQMVVLRVRPGITDPASVRYRHEGSILQRSVDPERLYREQILPEKLLLNLEYIKGVSLTGDLRLVLSTVKSVLSSSEA